MEVIFDFNPHSRWYDKALSAFKEAVRQAGGVINNFGMGVQGVDPTFKIHSNRSIDNILCDLTYNGYTITYDNGPVSILPPPRI